MMVSLRPVVLIALVGLLLLASVPVQAAPDDRAINPFQARYEVYASGVAIGEAVMSLSTPSPTRYQMRSQVQPNGLAALLVSSRIDEQVSGHIHEGVIRPERYERALQTPKKNQRVLLQFDWPNKQVRARDNDQQATLPLSPGVLDPLSLNLQVMSDLQQGRLPAEYTLADETEIKAYQIKNEGEELLETSLGKLPVVRISQSKPGKTRITTFWFASTLHYLPVKVAQHKDAKEILRMEIRGVER